MFSVQSTGLNDRHIQSKIFYYHEVTINNDCLCTGNSLIMSPE